MALKSTKLFIINTSKSNYSIYILYFIAFIEAIFFPIPPDFLFIPLAIIHYRKVFFLAFLAVGKNIKNYYYRKNIRQINTKFINQGCKLKR